MYKKILTLLILSFFTFLYTENVYANTWTANVERRIEYEYKIYSNQTVNRIKNLFNSIVSIYMQLDTSFFKEIDVNIKSDINFVKLKKKHQREIAFLKWLREKWVWLTELEERMFFPQLTHGKERSAIFSGLWEEYTETKSLNFSQIQWEFKFTVNTATWKIEVHKKKENGEYIKTYSWKTEIPKHTKIYKSEVVENEKNKHIYLIVWFFSDSGIGTNILSISWWANIELISNVSWLLINNNEKYNFETINCYQDYSYIIVKEKTLKFLCLDKKNDTIRERDLISLN